MNPQTNWKKRIITGLTVGTVAVIPAACNNLDKIIKKDSAGKLEWNIGTNALKPAKIGREVVGGWTDLIGGGLGAIKNSFPEIKFSGTDSPNGGVSKVEYIGKSVFEVVKLWETYKVTPPRKRITESTGVREVPQTDVTFTVKNINRRSGWHEVTGFMDEKTVTKWIQLDGKGNMVGFSNNAK